MLSRKRQVAAKIESQEGTAETLAAADAKILAYNPKMTFNPEMLDRDVVRSSFSPIGKLVGKRPGGYAFRIELRGSGAVATTPEWAKFLQACGFEVNSLKKITIGAITGGPFQHGETITGTSGTGRVVIKTTTGTTTLYYVVLSGTIGTGEVITGGTSGATATTGSAASDAGKEFKLITDSIPCLTIGDYGDGVRSLLSGARGKVKFTFKSGEPVFLDFDFSGVDGGVSDVALLSGIVHETTIPPAFLSASLLLDAYAARLGEMDLDIANVLTARDDVNAAKGLLSYAITGRRISGSYNPEMVTVATHDFYGKWTGGTEAILDFIVGSTTGNKFRFYGPKLQYTKVEDDARDGLQIAKCSFDLNGTVSPGNDELVMLML